MSARLVVPALVLLSFPAAAGADVLDTYQRLAARDLSPAPLVPSTLPRVFEPIERSAEGGTTIGGRGYAVRFLHHTTGLPDAVIEVSGGEYRRMKALLRERRRQGYSQRRTRVRGRRGYLLTRRSGIRSRELVWVESGVVYSIGSGTPRKVSVRALRSTARGLDRLEREYIGGAADPDNSSSASAVTTRRTVTLTVEFEAQCAPPGSTATTVRVGSAKVALLRREGDAFSFDVAADRDNEEPWTGTIAGTISPDAITLDVRAAGTIDGEACDTGALTLTLDQRSL